MKSRISKLIALGLFSIGALVSGCSSFDDSLANTAPVQSSNTQVRVLSGIFTGKRFTVKIEGQVVATNLEYGKLTPYTIVPTGAKNYEFIDEATKESFKFDIATLAEGSFQDFRPLGLRKGKNYTFVIYHPFDKSAVKTPASALDETKFILKAVLDDADYGLSNGQNAATVASIRPLLIYDNRDDTAYSFGGITTNDKKLDGRIIDPFSGNKFDLYATIGDPTLLSAPTEEGMYTAFEEPSSTFSYFYLKNNDKEFRFEGIKLQTGKTYTVVCSGSVKESDKNPLTVTLYSDKENDAPIVLKKAASIKPKAITENAVFNLAYGLSKYGSASSSSDFAGIRLDATLPGTTINYTLGRQINYNSKVSMDFSLFQPYITESMLTNMQNNPFVFNLAVMVGNSTVVEPALDSFTIAVPKSASVNFYVATDNTKKTVLFALPNTDFAPGSQRPVRIVNMVPDASIKIEFEVKSSATIIPLATLLGFGTQSDFVELPLDDVTIIVRDNLNNELSRMDLATYSTSKTYTTITLSGTADTADDASDASAVLSIKEF